jgi:hypothetical protein
VAAAAPDAAGAHGSLAASLALEGDFQQAAREYELAYARSYKGDFLNDFGVALAQLGRNDEAECVMIEGAWYGGDALAALRNVAIFVARDPDRRLVHEADARYLLALAAYNVKLGKIHLDARTRARVFVQIAAYKMPSSPPPWPRGSCAILRTKQ